MAAGRPEPPELAEFLEPFDDDVVEIARRLRVRLIAEMPAAREFVWDATNAVSLVYTPTARWQDGICHIAVYTRHANLGFNDGAALPDPLGLLVGSGARIRHVTIRSVDEATAPWIADYVRAAMADAGMTAEMGDGGTTVRRSACPKRRPHQRVR
jgi:hypothetical protein